MFVRDFGTIDFIKVIKGIPTCLHIGGIPGPKLEGKITVFEKVY